MSIRCIAINGPPGRRDPIGSTRRQACEGPGRNVCTVAITCIPVAAAESTALDLRPCAIERDPCVRFIQDRCCTDRLSAEPKDVIGAIDIGKQRVVREAIPVDERCILPGHQRRAIHILPTTDLTGIAEVEQIEVAVKTDLAVGVHRDGEPLFNPQNVVADTQVHRCALDT